jgi:Holliday junction resolvase YEN1
VDTVWYDDGDTLIFGCGLLFRGLYQDKGRNSGNSGKSDTHVRLYRANTIWEQHQLDSSGLVLFAVLSEADYATQGLKNCGPETALRAAEAGLGRSLCSPATYGVVDWRKELSDFYAFRISIDIPTDFPQPKDLNN